MGALTIGYQQTEVAVRALRGASERFSEAARLMGQASRRLAPGRWASD